MITLIFLAYLTCSAFTYAATLAYFWRQFPMLQPKPGRWSEVRSRALRLAALGPIGLFVTVIYAEGYRYGFIWRWRK